MTILKIYTDGGCSGNQNDKNIGGWGAILESYGDDCSPRSFQSHQKAQSNYRSIFR